MCGVNSKPKIIILPPQSPTFKHFNILCGCADVTSHQVLNNSPEQLIPHYYPVRPVRWIPTYAQRRLRERLRGGRRLLLRFGGKRANLGRRAAAASSNCTCADNDVVLDVGIQWRDVKMEWSVSVYGSVAWRLLVYDSDDVVCHDTIGYTGYTPVHIYGVWTERLDIGCWDTLGIWGKNSKASGLAKFHDFRNFRNFVNFVMSSRAFLEPHLHFSVDFRRRPCLI